MAITLPYSIRMLVSMLEEKCLEDGNVVTGNEYTKKNQEIHSRRMTTHDNLYYTNIESCSDNQAPPLTN